MKKKLLGVIKLQLIAGQATPAPPVGPALGKFGIDLIRFSKEYNEKTSTIKGTLSPVKIYIYEDKSFKLNIKSIPTSKLILNNLNKLKGSSTPNSKYIGSLNKNTLLEIAKIKHADLFPLPKEAVIEMIKGTAKSMGVYIS